MKHLYDFSAHTHPVTHTCGSMERWMGGVRVGCMPPLLNDSERGGREGSEMRWDTLCCSAGELCLFILDRSSTWDRPHTTVTRSTINHHASPTTVYQPPCFPVHHLCKPRDALKILRFLKGQQPEGGELMGNSLVFPVFNYIGIRIRKGFVVSLIFLVITSEQILISTRVQQNSSLKVMQELNWQQECDQCVSCLFRSQSKPTAKTNFLPVKFN